MKYKIDFDSLDWLEKSKGIRDKCVDQNGIRSRLVEYTKEMPLHWCTKAHYGIILSGKMRIKFKGESHVYKEGDCLYLPPGKKHMHEAIILTEKVTVFFIEPLYLIKEE
ncbi:MAG: cupin domain-containing protein [Bacteroidales bacterium]